MTQQIRCLQDAGGLLTSQIMSRNDGYSTGMQASSFAQMEESNPKAPARFDVDRVVEPPALSPRALDRHQKVNHNGLVNPSRVAESKSSTKETDGLISVAIYEKPPELCSKISLRQQMRYSPPNSGRQDRGAIEFGKVVTVSCCPLFDRAIFGARRQW